MADPDPIPFERTCDGSSGAASGTSPCVGSGARRPLSCERIVDAAVRYVDHDCLDGLSMRRLGAELGVEAMSLYRYFPSKSALLDAVVCRMLADITMPEADDALDWEGAVRAFARSFRATSAAHPRLLPLLATLGPSNPSLAAMDRRMTDLWRSAGLAQDVAVMAQAALQGYLMGSCLRDHGTTAGDGAFVLGLEALIAGMRDRVGGVPGAA